MEESQNIKNLRNKYPSTFEWLNDNIASEDDVLLERSFIRKHYQDYCRQQSIEPAAGGVFGKIVKSIFKYVGYKRLGSR